MFQKQSKDQPFYLQKKKLFHQSIRKKQREAIINKLRKKAQIPNQIDEMLKNLPGSLKELVNLIVKGQVRNWQQVIAEQILISRDRVREMLDCKQLQESEAVSLFIFLLNNSPQPEQLYRQHYEQILLKSQSWSYPNKMHLFVLFHFMLKKGHSFVLEHASAFHSTLYSNRFFYSQLNFYDLILRKYATPTNIEKYLPHETLRRLSEQVEAHFYNEEQRLKMIQILIQVLYLSEEEDISKCLDVTKLFTRLQFLIGYNKNKLLVDRSILLIYNINIDSTSESFVNHSCFKVITNQIKNTLNPFKIRVLCTQLYLNSILNYPKHQYHSFLHSNISTILNEYLYIVEEFTDVKDVREMIAELLSSILTHLAEESQQGCPVTNKIQGQAALVEKLSTIQQCLDLLTKFQIIKR